MQNFMYVTTNMILLFLALYILGRCFFSVELENYLKAGVTAEHWLGYLIWRFKK